ncbi:MAG: SRPBCC family protein [Myxococcota bacterium]
MEVVVTQRFEVSADVIWNLLRDFGGIQRWNQGVLESVVVEGEGIGAIRTIGLPGGGSLQEKLEAHDDSTRSFSYSFTGKPLLPVEDYLASMTVIPLDESSCEVCWESTFGPGEMTEELARSTVEGIYGGGLEALRKTVEG